MLHVDTAGSVHEALSVLEGKRYDGIISDYQMPDVDGLDFLLYVRENFGEIPFILFTGRGREEVVISALNRGADYYWICPYISRHLLSLNPLQARCRRYSRGER